MFVVIFLNVRTKETKSNASARALVIFCYLFQDGNGTIENEELRGFLKDLLELVKKVKFKIHLGRPPLSGRRIPKLEK